VDGAPVAVGYAHEFLRLKRVWHRARATELPNRLTAAPCPPPRYGGLYGWPVVLAGLCDESGRCWGDMAPRDDAHSRQRARVITWRGTYSATGQVRGLRFKPLHDIAT
jgi:hypothetical protein